MDGIFKVHRGARHQNRALLRAVPNRRNALDFGGIPPTKATIPMALRPPPTPWDLLQQVGELIGGSGVKDEVDRSARALAQSALSRLDMVSREEFDAQTEILQRTRTRVVALEAALEELTRELDTLTKTK
jgi:BMFP domain-containing protein YqiC